MGKNNWKDISRILREIWQWKAKKTDMSVFKKYFDETMAKKKLLFQSAERFGTPQYVLDEEKLMERVKLFCSSFRKYIPESKFFYAFKSNDLPYLVKRLQSMGINADVAGLFELQLALKFGFNKIIFTGPGKNKEELKLAIDNRSRVIINIDNIAELKFIIKMLEKDKRKEKIRISFRVNPDKAIMQTWSKFGIEIKDLRKVVNLAKKCNKLQWRGIQFHCSWNLGPEKYVENIRIISNLLFRDFSKEELSELSFFDIGGGFYPEGTAKLSSFTPKGTLVESLKEHFDNENNDFGFDALKIINEPVEPIEKFAKAISEALERYLFKRLGKRINIFLEPGRFISFHSSLILVRAMYDKSEKSIIVNGGLNLIGEYRSDIEFIPIINLSNPSFQLKEKIIYGPLCDPNDFWGKAYFGKKIEEGDLLAILNQGAYTFTFAWRLIKPIAPYVSICRKKIQLVKECERFKDRYAGCRF